MSDQFLRRASLTVIKGATGIDLSQLRMSFQVRQFENQTPNTAIIRVYNVSPETVNELLGLNDDGGVEYSRVILQAGYEPEDQFGVIFDGTIKQYRRGRERNVDNYLDILAGDNDLGYNFGALNQTLQAGAKSSDIVDAINAAMGVQTGAQVKGLIGGTILARGKVMYGLARALMRDVAATNQGRWFVENGVMNFVPLSGFLEGEAVVLDSKSGLVGVPEATDDGVEAKCLLNPNLRIGRRVQIDNKDINTPFVEAQGFPQFTAFSFPASVTTDGMYRVIVAEHEGDTRGGPWYTKLTCLAVDRTSKPINSVKSFGTIAPLPTLTPKD